MMNVLSTMGVIAMMASNSIAAGVPESPLVGEYKSIDGKQVDLSSYEGKVVLIVNVASKCGFTKQYKGLQELYEKYKERGLVILGFPCSQFAGQEYKDDDKIKSFCTTNFRVTFPMFSRVKVRGKDAIPLYKYLSSKQAPIKDTGGVKWNFEKFLINRKGELVERFRSRVKPGSEEMTTAIEALL